MAEFPIIKTPRLLLRQFSEHDLKNVYTGLSHPEVIKFYGISFHTLEETKQQLKWFSDLEISGTGIWWAICSADNQKFLGAAGFSSIEKKFKNAEIGMWLVPEFWRMGIMTEVIPLLCKYGFDHLDFHRIEGFVESENIACKNAILKAGFTYEGTRRECELQHGRFISLEIYSRLSSDTVT